MNLSDDKVTAGYIYEENTDYHCIVWGIDGSIPHTFLV